MRMQFPIVHHEVDVVGEQNPMVREVVHLLLLQIFALRRTSQFFHPRRKNYVVRHYNHNHDCYSFQQSVVSISVMEIDDTDVAVAVAVVDLVGFFE